MPPQTRNRINATSATNPNLVSSVNPQIKPLNVVLAGQKIVAKVMDDDYVKGCADGCAAKLGVTAKTVSTGRAFISALVSSTATERLASCIFWGHSWNIGLYLQDDQGFYVDTTYDPVSHLLPAGAAKLTHLKAANIKTRPHSLFIFASCGTAADDYIPNTYSVDTFAGKFGLYINKTMDVNSVQDGVSFYKVTVIAATGLSNLFKDGTARTDGKFIKIERRFFINKFALMKPQTTGSWWNKKTTLVFDRWSITVGNAGYKTTDLGKKIDTVKLIKEHDPDDVEIK